MAWEGVRLLLRCAGHAVPDLQRKRWAHAAEDAARLRPRLWRMKKGWSKQFEDPILLPDGRELITLKNAADDIMKLPKAEQKHERWQTAIEVLIMAAEGRGLLMHARIGVLQAMNRDKQRVLTDRKDHHWGKRKLARDRNARLK
jgi:hypothetical protein